MIRGVVIVAVLAGCVIATIIQLPAWHDDRALWTEAASVTDLPRPLLHLAEMALKEGDVGATLALDRQALDRLIWHPTETVPVRAVIASHIRWILATSTSNDVCPSRDWASWCPSS